MITSKSEYLFVSGSDMDLITIDGSVMPLRSGNTASGQPFQNVLRGEDVCFLMEAWAERLQLETRLSPAYTFDRRVGPDMQGLLQLIYGIESHTFVDSVPSDTYDTTSSFLQEWVADHQLTCDDIDVAEGAFDAGEKLAKSNMLGVFSTTRKVVTIWNQLVSSASGNTYCETQSMDAEYPYSPTSTIGYRSYGGESLTDSEGVVHPNAYGGWQIRFYNDEWNESGSLSAMSTTPSSVEFFASEQFQHIQNGTTTNKYQYVKLGDCTVSSGRASYSDSHSAQRARLIAAMDRYWGISPGFLSTGDTLQVVMRDTPHQFVHVGDHTKWW